MKRHMKKLSLILVVAVAGFVGFAGSIIEWDSAKAAGNWSVGDNWVGGSAPTGLDAAKFTVPQGEEWVIGVDSDVNVTNLWLYGGGTLKLKEAGGSSLLVWGDSDKAAYDSGKKVYNVGSGRQSMLVSEGSTLVVDGVAVTNLQQTTYHDLQMNGDSKLVVTNGAEFIFPIRAPATGASALNSDGFDILVTGEGSVFGKPTKGGSQFRGVNSSIRVENGGRLLDQVVFYQGPEGLTYSFANNASFNQSTTITIYGSDNTIVLDGQSTGKGGNSLELSDNAENFNFKILNGSEFETTSYRWGKKLAQGNTTTVSNATLKITGYMTLGANSGSEVNHSKNNSIIIQKDGFLNCPNAPQTFDVGWYSENDLLFIDGGRLYAKRTSRIGYLDCSGTVFKVRGETAEAEFDGTLSFDNAVTLSAELPLPTDRAVISCTGAVTINDGTKFEITVPEPVTAPTQYTILTGKSITGMIALADVSVNGEAKATLTKSDDGKSLILTLKPKTATGMIVIFR